MTQTFQILTVLGSPHDRKSNTRALVDDFVDELAEAGLPLEHRVISLGRKKVNPCRGCWNCTKDRPCPVSRTDDLEEIKAAMIDCDFLILASPVYTNNISAQMKALFDRLFTWCHIFPMLGKPALSATTTGSEGHDEAGRFLEKMLGTWGAHSFGTLSSLGGFTPGFFPTRQHARSQHRKLAQRVAATLLSGKPLGVTRWQRKMYKVMRRKMGGVHTFNSLYHGMVEGQPRPNMLRVRIMRLLFGKFGITDDDRARLGTFMAFELGWWRARGWLWARTFKQLAAMRLPEGFDTRRRLLAAPAKDAADERATA